MKALFNETREEPAEYHFTANEIAESAGFDEVYPYLYDELIHDLGNLMLKCLERYKCACAYLGEVEAKRKSDWADDHDRQLALVDKMEGALTDIMAETDEESQMKSVCAFLWNHDKEPLEYAIEAWSKQVEKEQ